MSGRLFRQLPPPTQQQLQRDEAVINARISSASDNKLVVLGSITLPIILKDMKDQTHRVKLDQVPLLVIENLSADCIIGNNQLEYLFEHISVKHRQATYVDGNSGLLRTLALSRPPNKDEDTASLTIMLIKPVKILPQCEVILNVGCISEQDTHTLRDLWESCEGTKDKQFCMLEPTTIIPPDEKPEL